MIRLLIILLLPFYLYSYQIEFNKTFSHDLSHDILKAYLSIKISDKSESSLKKRLDIYDNKIKSFNKVEKKLMAFDIRPKFRHANNTPKVSGYIGELRYKVSSNKAEPMNKLITEISDMKKTRDTSVSLYSLKWSPKKSTYNVTLDVLRYEAINWGINYAKSLSIDLSTKCQIININLNTEEGKHSPLIERYAFSNEKVLINNSSIPIINQKHAIVHVNYVMECE